VCSVWWYSSRYCTTVYSVTCHFTVLYRCDSTVELLYNLCISPQETGTVLYLAHCEGLHVGQPRHRGSIDRPSGVLLMLVLPRVSPIACAYSVLSYFLFLCVRRSLLWPLSCTGVPLLGLHTVVCVFYACPATAWPWLLITVARFVPVSACGMCGIFRLAVVRCASCVEVLWFPACHCMFL
jgi:hypothetical protein